MADREIYKKILQEVDVGCLCWERNNSYLFFINDALKVTEWLYKNNFVILGFDGFDIDVEGHLLPRLDYIADFSNIASSNISPQEKILESYTASKNVLQDFKGNVTFVEFATATDDE